MNQIVFSKPNLPFGAVAVCTATLLMTACGVNSVKPDQVSETESCTRLQGIIKDHPNKFDSYKRNYSNYKTHRAWTADKLLPSAKQCQIWEWSTGLLGYTCEWQIEKGEEQAIANYDEANKVIGNCLGKDWLAETNSTSSGGKHAIYSTANSPTVVSIRYFHDTAGWDWLHKWHNTIFIGDRSNLNTPLQ